MSANANTTGSSGSISDDHDRFRQVELLDHEVESARHDANSRAQLLKTATRLRQERDLSQREVARQMKTTQSAVSDLEKGLTDPRLSTLQRYARAIRCRVDIILADDDPAAGPSWLNVIHFRSWRNRSLPYSNATKKVRVQKTLPLFGSLIEAGNVGGLAPEPHVRNLSVGSVQVVEEKDLRMSAVSGV